LIGKTEVDSLLEIITKYGNELGLKYPCPGSPFQSIFHRPVKKINISEGYQHPDIE